MYQQSEVQELDTGNAIVEALNYLFHRHPGRTLCLARRAKGWEVWLEDRSFHDFLPQQQ
jgi:hypothetical protein